MAEIDARLESEMSPERKLRLGRIQFRAWRRGFREADMVLGPFADQVAPGLDDGELEATLDKLRKEGAREGSWSISRFKGLGEMSAEQLWETTLNPDTRRLLPVAWGALSFDETVGSFTKLMGKGEAASRRELMELHGDSVEVDV